MLTKDVVSVQKPCLLMINSELKVPNIYIHIEDYRSLFLEPPWTNQYDGMEKLDMSRRARAAEDQGQTLATRSSALAREATAARHSMSRKSIDRLPGGVSYG